MPQTISPSQLQKFLSQTEPFDRLSTESQEWLSSKCQLLQYRMGQAIFVQETMPTQVSIIYQGHARLLGYGAYGALQVPTSLNMLGNGDILGWAGLVRGVACETAIASDEIIVITIPANDFLELLAREPAVKRAFYDRCSLSEVYQLLVAELQRRADGTTDAKELAAKITQKAVVLNLAQGSVPAHKLDPNLIWLVSGGAIADFPVGSRLDLTRENFYIQSGQGARLLGFREPARASNQDIPYAPAEIPIPEVIDDSNDEPRYSPYIKGLGPVEHISRMKERGLGEGAVPKETHPSSSRFWDKTDRIAVSIAGGAALGGAIAQVPGAIIGGLLAATYGCYISFVKPKSARNS